MGACKLTALVLGAFVGLQSISWGAPPQPASTPKGDAPVVARRLPGQQPSGEVLLPTQWSLLPAGTQIPLGDFPVNIALHPKEPWAAVLHAGHGDHEVAIVDLKEGKVVS